MNIVLLGAPGSGKGSIAELIERDFPLKHISAGQLLRDMAKTDKALADFLKTGNLLSDKEITKYMQERFGKPDLKNGVIIDGYPRTLGQAKDLDSFCKVDLVLLLEVDEEEVYKRLQNRLGCPVCQHVYNKLLYKANTCSNCGARLEVRSDDNFETIKNRLQIYNKEIQPILDYYKGKILVVKAKPTPEKTYSPVKKFLQKEVQKSGCEISR